MSELETVRARFSAHVHDLQDRIVAALAAVDPGLAVVEDPWQRTDREGQPGGGGRTRALSGDVFENAGVNVSEVFGAIDPAFVRQLGGEEGDRLWAAGISLILHPRNPRVPTVHANFRMITLGEKVWFGGGADLTPYFPHVEDFSHFHRTWCRAVPDRERWSAWKAWCDRYFTNHHRNGEMRGIGGIFFDHHFTGDITGDAAASMALSEHFLPSYLPLVERRKDEPFTAEDEAFMLFRHGRYVEFNLLHDRGTHFGLRTDGRTDSILISLPARCAFGYKLGPPAGSVHEAMMAWYYPHDWASALDDDTP